MTDDGCCRATCTSTGGGSTARRRRKTVGYHEENIEADRRPPLREGESRPLHYQVLHFNSLSLTIFHRSRRSPAPLPTPHQIWASHGHCTVRRRTRSMGEFACRRMPRGSGVQTHAHPAARVRLEEDGRALERPRHATPPPFIRLSNLRCSTRCSALCSSGVGLQREDDVPRSGRGSCMDTSWQWAWVCSKAGEIILQWFPAGKERWCKLLPGSSPLLPV
ncbi:unnamed protein product [Ixodes pacificus]